MKVTPRCANSRGRDRTGLEFDMTNGTCSSPQCEKAPKKRGLCESHYLRARRNGTLPREWVSRMNNTLADFLLERIEVDASGCWLWTGRKWPNGYGMIGGKPSKQAGTVMSHRAVYELHSGEIPAGLVLDHLCRNLICCNPEHLEPVTQAENVARGLSPKAVAFRNGTCTKGHEVKGANAYEDRHGNKMCRQCRKANRSARYQRDKAARNANA